MSRALPVYPSVVAPKKEDAGITAPSWFPFSHSFSLLSGAKALELVVSPECVNTVARVLASK